MAHTLKAYYYTTPDDKITVDLMGAVSTNSGIALDAYQMGMPGIEQARNNSLYSDSPRPVYSKHGTVTDVLTVTVRGSTNTALYTNLHLLAKLGEYARSSSQFSREVQPAYLEMKPGGSSSGEVLYAMIYDCRVELPADWANNQDATLTIEDVTVTIERGLWRMQLPSNTTADSTPFALTGQSFAGSASSSQDIGGDTGGLFSLYVQHDSGSIVGAIDKAIIGYRSKALAGVNYNDCGKFESESATMGTDTSAVADATASGGNIARCTFGTTTTAAIRISGAKLPYGVHRMFARMKVTGSPMVATVYLSYGDGTVAQGATFSANASVLVSSTSYLCYDLGIVNVQRLGGYGSFALSTYQIYASLTSGTGNLDIDWVYCMPTEGYITLSGLGIGTSSPTAAIFGTVFNSNESVGTIGATMVGSARTQYPQFTASLNPLPGACALYWLIGTGTDSAFDVGIHASLTIQLGVTHRYLMPSVV